MCHPLSARRSPDLVAVLLVALWFFFPVPSPGSESPRIEFLGAEDFPKNAGCVGISAGASDVPPLFSWAPRFFIVAKVDGRVERLDLEETTESHARKGEWRNGDRIRQRFSSERTTALLNLTLTKECLEEEGCKDGTTYQGDLTILVKESGRKKTMRIEVSCGC